MKRKTNNSRPLKSSESIAEKIDMNPRQVITKTEKIDELKAEVQALRAKLRESENNIVILTRAGQNEINRLKKTIESLETKNALSLDQRSNESVCSPSKPSLLREVVWEIEKFDPSRPLYESDAFSFADQMFKAFFGLNEMGTYGFFLSCNPLLDSFSVQCTFSVLHDNIKGVHKARKSPLTFQRNGPSMMNHRGIYNYITRTDLEQYIHPYKNALLRLSVTLDVRQDTLVAKQSTSKAIDFNNNQFDIKKRSISSNASASESSVVTYATEHSEMRRLTQRDTRVKCQHSVAITIEKGKTVKCQCKNCFCTSDKAKGRQICFWCKNYRRKQN